MRLTELHSSRIEDIIRSALREYRSEHDCECEDCEEIADRDYDTEDAVVRFQDIDVKKVTQEILLQLTKLEGESGFIRGLSR